MSSIRIIYVLKRSYLNCDRVEVCSSRASFQSTLQMFRDPSEVAFSRCFVYGNEWTWLSFESLLFVVSYLLFNSIHLSCLLVYVLSRYDHFLTMNLKKTFSIIPDKEYFIRVLFQDRKISNVYKSKASYNKE